MSSSQPMALDGPATPKVSYDDSWELYKPLLDRLYLQENLKLPRIQDIMREQYHFHAQPHQYKYRFKKWGWEKSLTSVKKKRVLEIGQRRAAQGRSTAVTHQGRKVDGKQLLRLVQERKVDLKMFSKTVTLEIPGFRAESLLGHQIGFLGWNIPELYIRRRIALTQNHPSPFDVSNTPPSDISVHTPPSPEGMSPGLYRAVSFDVAELNAEKLMVGDFGALLRSLDGNGKRVLADWMNQFWFFSFLTAKHWGSSRSAWTSNDLESYTRTEISAAPSPQYQGPEMSTFAAPSPRSTMSLSSGTRALKPKQLCRWSIHVSSDEWEYDRTQLENPTPLEDYGNQSPKHAIESRLQEALESNSFSNIPESDLPVSLKRISEIVSKSPAELFYEGLRFAIMSRNIELVTEMVEQAMKKGYQISTIHPLHLALTYLDGSRSCCQIFRILLRYRQKLGLAVNDLGPSEYSMFDTLMVHILRNHSQVSPEIFNSDLTNAKIFGGEEVDCCGRWDADSYERCHLAQTGSDIPSSWKHKFCNTSIQVVCHCLQELGNLSNNFKTGSLSLRRCFTCGLRMTLPPAHLVVLTAWHVATSGSEDEDLLGMICVLLCMATSSPPRGYRSPEQSLFCKTPIDTAMFGHDDSSSSDVCMHEVLRPSELARKLSTSLERVRHSVVEKGWSIFCRILEQIEAQYLWVELGNAPLGYTLDLMDSDDNIDDMDSDVSIDDLEYMVFHYEPRNWSSSAQGYNHMCDHLEVEIGRSFGRNTTLGHLWAVCQAELLTYRRRQLDSSWISEYVSIDTIEQYLISENPDTLPMFTQRILGHYCRCGIFDGWRQCPAPRRKLVCGTHLNDLDDVKRSAYLDDADFERDDGV